MIKFVAVIRNNGGNSVILGEYCDVRHAHRAIELGEASS